MLSANKQNLEKLCALREYKLKKLQIDLNKNSNQLLESEAELDKLNRAVQRSHNNRISSQKNQFNKLQHNTISGDALQEYRSSIKAMIDTEEDLRQQISERKRNIHGAQKVIKTQKKTLKYLNKKIEGLKFLNVAKR